MGLSDILNCNLLNMFGLSWLQSHRDPSPSVQLHNHQTRVCVSHRALFMASGSVIQNAVHHHLTDLLIYTRSLDAMQVWRLYQANKYES